MEEGESSRRSTLLPSWREYVFAASLLSLPPPLSLPLSFFPTSIFSCLRLLSVPEHDWAASYRIPLSRHTRVIHRKQGMLLLMLLLPMQTKISWMMKRRRENEKSSMAPATNPTVKERWLRDYGLYSTLMNRSWGLGGREKFTSYPDVILYEIVLYSIHELSESILDDWRERFIEWRTARHWICCNFFSVLRKSWLFWVAKNHANLICIWLSFFSRVNLCDSV